jgi:hypothetical protein
MRQSTQRGNGPETAAAIANAIFTDSPPASYQDTEYSIRSPISEEAASAPIGSLFAEAGRTGPSANRATSAAAEDPSPQTASPISCAQDQKPDPPDVPPTKDRATLAPPDSLALCPELPVPLEANPARDLSMRPLLKVTSNAPDADASAAPFRPIPRSAEAFQPPSGSGLTADPSINSAGNAIPTGAQVNSSAGSPQSEASLAELAEKLSYHLLRLAGNDRHEVVLRLHPPELGDLTVRVQVAGRDVSAWFASPQIQVQQAISDAIGQLHTNLGNAGYSLNSAWIGADAWSRGERDATPALPQQQRGAANRTRIEETTVPPMLSAASEVSVYV